MAEGRGDGRRGGDAGNGGDTARCGDLAAAGEHLPALRLRSLGAAVATPPRPGERHRGALCRDDLVAGFEHQADAKRLVADWKDRLGQFALTLHPDKTRLIEFGRFAAANRAKRGLGKPETFNFLGFTHISGRTRNGKFCLHRKTRRDRLRAKLREVKETLRRRLHATIHEQGAWLRQVVRGYFAYHAVPTNIQALAAFRRTIRWLWWRNLRRRSQKDRTSWAAINRLVDRWLPKPRITHPWPEQRPSTGNRSSFPGSPKRSASRCAGSNLGRKVCWSSA